MRLWSQWTRRHQRLHLPLLQGVGLRLAVTWVTVSVAVINTWYKPWKQLRITSLAPSSPSWWKWYDGVEQLTLLSSEQSSRYLRPDTLPKPHFLVACFLHLCLALYSSLPLGTKYWIHPPVWDISDSNSSKQLREAGHLSFDYLEILQQT